MTMQRWVRRILGTFALGGGAVGLETVASVVPNVNGIILWMIVFVFLGIYTFGIWCGIAMLEGRSNANRINSAYWLLQIPALKTYGLSYFLSSGFHITLWLGWNPMEFLFNFRLGSAWSFYLFTVPDTSMAGINVFALAMLCYLRVLVGRRTEMSVTQPAEAQT